jgi:glucose/arabinose dehydrogenase
MRIRRVTRAALAAALVLSCNDDSGAAVDETGGTSAGTSSGSASATLTGSATTPTTGGPPTTDASDPDASADATVDSTAGPSSSSGEETGELPCPYRPVDGEPTLGLEQVGSGFDRPVFAIGHPTEPDRLFVVEQGGAIRILEPGMTTAPDDAFAQLNVACAGNGTLGCEMGMFSMAFHPDFPADPRVYVAYSPGGQALPPTRVAELTLAEGDPNHVGPDVNVILDAAQPFGNHNGGQIAFGPDRMLYIGLGDGGDGFDTAMTGRDPGVILAKILRIDPEPDGEPDEPIACLGLCAMPGPFDYTIPEDNPFVDDAAFAPETYAWGFRNPWRFSFDADDGTLWVGDVGQDQWEEIDTVIAGGDYGWSALEGNHCENDVGCDTSAAPNQPNGAGQIAPLFEYPHGNGPTQGCSVTGGAVYRSCEVPAWDGIYLYGDYCTPQIRGLRADGTDLGVLADSDVRVLGYGTNAHGDVFFTTADTIVNGPNGDGIVYRVAPLP